MLAADADLQVRTGTASSVDTDFKELPDSFLVNGLERIRIEDLVAEVVAHESSYVIAREAECHLSEVIGTE